MAEISPSVPPEIIVWEGRSSQVLNIGIYAVCGFLTIAVLGVIVQFPAARSLGWVGFFVPAVIALYAWLKVRSIQYTLTDQRLKISSGILNKRIDSLELYRVRDITMVKPFLLRLVQRGHVVMNTSDQTTPVIKIRAIAESEYVSDLVRANVELQRQRRRVAEIAVQE
ncbi:MAG: PH domain-containing protein [Phycisphaeraceae bacterium]|nr:PH domain-containing protein [Phycisphaeraceae bacterium]